MLFIVRRDALGDVCAAACAGLNRATSLLIRAGSRGVNSVACRILS